MLQFCNSLTLIESCFNSQNIGRFESPFITSGFNDPQKKTVFINICIDLPFQVLFVLLSPFINFVTNLYLTVFVVKYIVFIFTPSFLPSLAFFPSTQNVCVYLIYLCFEKVQGSGDITSCLAELWTGICCFVLSV